MEKAAEKPPTKRRAKGEQTRSKILDAALRVIARQGIRSVTHRAVATEAEVQLSLTTYYFKDINDLISEAFVRYTTRGRPELDDLWAKVEVAMDRFPPAERRRIEQKEMLCAQLSALAEEYIAGQIQEHGDNLVVEQVFFAELSLGPEIKQLVDEHRQALYQPLVTLCRRFNRKDPEVEAEILLRTILSYEYDAISKPFDDEARQHLARLVSRLMGWVMGLKRQ
ncbi:TetR/AcrR family transcriptional regulator [Ferrimonas marina]|uniref:Transcriptional regulator, TetR family n=1 Tax=Ferrimonas marina TaxID=299255 RepID=A0A1M5MJV3_9GAMM|nr:TetR family transcriptional regulator [Ferrimonas marina]SHG77189.1 transcriptional regulator, TetR family [Ferrimonas marina]